MNPVDSESKVKVNFGVLCLRILVGKRPENFVPSLHILYTLIVRNEGMNNVDFGTKEVKI